MPKPPQEAPIYNRIQLLRTERGMSRQQLADALNVHYQTIGYLERGEYSPSIQLALKAAQVFELPVEAMFSLSEFPSLSAEALMKGR